MWCLNKINIWVQFLGKSSSSWWNSLNDKVPPTFFVHLDRSVCRDSHQPSVSRLTKKKKKQHKMKVILCRSLASESPLFMAHIQRKREHTDRETHTHFLLFTRRTAPAVFHLNEFLSSFLPSPLAAALWWKT